MYDYFMKVFFGSKSLYLNYYVRGIALRMKGYKDTKTLVVSVPKSL